ncbi:MAG: TetR/AcrR family transcriptional regulator [Oscillatoriales cyanobacterium]|nr:MAG: TetR/AcrR family transcriptional regulator [Oscillatoriales cyanobacterium]
MRKKPKQARSQARVDRILDVAEQLFTTEGYNATTTNAIAAQAGVPIGSLYQFFPDKNAIIGALAERYNDQMYELFTALHTVETAQLPLPAYVDRVVDTFDHFFVEHPGYSALFMPLQGLPELEAVDAAGDERLIHTYSEFFCRYYPVAEPETYTRVAFVLVKAIGNLLWLALGQAPNFRQALVVETKRLMVCYLASYLPSNLADTNDAPAN